MIVTDMNYIRKIVLKSEPTETVAKSRISSVSLLNANILLINLVK